MVAFYKNRAFYVFLATLSAFVLLWVLRSVWRSRITLTPDWARHQRTHHDLRARPIHVLLPPFDAGQWREVRHVGVVLGRWAHMLACAVRRAPARNRLAIPIL